MKKICLLLFMILSSLFLRAQLVDDTLGCVPMLVKYTSPVQAQSGIFWDFGDGVSSDKLNPTHVYSTSGIFDVKLSINNVVISSKKIKVLPEPDLKFIADIYGGCTPLKVNFTNTSTIPSELVVNSYLWDFGDGSSATINNPSHTYILDGNYNIAMNINTNIPKCNVTKLYEKVIKVRAKQPINIKLDSVTICGFPKKAYLKYLGIQDPSFTYKWDFGNGQTSSSITPELPVYSSPGKYKITLIVDNGTGCLSQIEKEIDLPKEKIDFNIITKDTVCKNEELDLKVGPYFNKFTWYFDTSASKPIVEKEIPRDIEYGTFGDKIIRVTYIDEKNCLQDTILKIHVEKVDATFTLDDSMSCSLPVTFKATSKNKGYPSYQWNNQDSTNFPFYNFLIKDIKRDTLFLHDSMKYFLNVIVTSKHNCVGNHSEKILVKKPNALFSLSNIKGIAPATVSLKDESESLFPIKKWKIIWGDGTENEYDTSTISGASHTFIDSGNYYIKLQIETEKGCVDEYFGAWYCVITFPKDTVKGEDNDSDDSLGCKGLLYRHFPQNLDAKTKELMSFISIGSSICTPIFGVQKTVSKEDFKEMLDQYVGDKESVYDYGVSFTGPRAKFQYNIDCNNQRRLLLKNKSLNYTKLKWTINGKIIENASDSFYYELPDYGEYIISLDASHKDDTCTSSTFRHRIKISEPSVDIIGANKFCEEQEFSLSAIGTNHLEGCAKGYLWKFDNKRAPIITSDTFIKIKLPKGDYRISAEVVDHNGCKDIKYMPVKIYGMEPDFFTEFPRICDSVDMTLKDITKSDTSIVSWKWNVNTEANKSEISHIFTFLPDSVYRIILEVKDALGCTKLVEKSLPIFEVGIEAKADSIICQNGLFLGSANNLFPKEVKLNYEWILENKVLSKDSMIVTEAIGKAGKFNLIVKGYDPVTGCNAKLIKPLTVLERPTAIIDNFSDSLFCYPKTIKFDGSKSVFPSGDSPKYLWSFGNGNSSIVKDPVETFNRGIFKISLIARSKFGCTDTAYSSVRVVGPEGKGFADKSQICRGDDITFTVNNLIDVNNYYWDLGQGEIIANTNPLTYKYKFRPPSGNTFATLVLQSIDDQCETTYKLPITIIWTEARFEDTVSCDKSFEIKNLSYGADKATWKVDNNVVSNDFNPVLNFQNFGVYDLNLSVSDSAGLCKDNITKKIEIAEQASLPFENFSLCEQESLTFALNPKFNYEFEPADIGVVSGNNITFTTDKDILLKIKADNDGLCVVEKSITINHSTLKSDEISDTIALCGSDQSISISLVKGDSISWTFNGDIDESDLSCTNCVNPIISANASGIAQLYIINKSLCTEKTYIFSAIQASFQVPNVFSPNDDGNNDFFRPIVIPFSEQDKIRIESLKIYNRWGAEIANITEPWDGKINGLPATEEVYYFLLNYSLDGSCTQSVKGNVTLIR